MRCVSVEVKGIILDIHLVSIIRVDVVKDCMSLILFVKSMLLPIGVLCSTESSRVVTHLTLTFHRVVA